MTETGAGAAAERDRGWVRPKFSTAIYEAVKSSRKCIQILEAFS